MTIYRKKQALSPRFLLATSTVLLIGLLLSSKAWAATFYVSDTTLELILRSGPDIKHRIVASLPVGTRVTFIREENGWAEMSLADGRTGWTPKRYLSYRPPWRITAEKLLRDKKRLEAQISEIEKSSRELQEENDSLENELTTLEQNIKDINHKHKTLKKEATNYIGLQKAHKKLSLELPELKANLEEAQKAYDELQSSDSMLWFLYGAGVIISGWFLAFTVSGRRRRRSSQIYR